MISLLGLGAQMTIESHGLAEESVMYWLGILHLRTTGVCVNISG